MLIRTVEGMRFLIDPDDPARQPSGVTTYKISPEEIEKKYGPVNKNKKYLKAFFDSTEVRKIRGREKQNDKNMAY